MSWGRRFVESTDVLLVFSPIGHCLLLGAGGSERSPLLKVVIAEVEQGRDAPVLGDLAVDDPHGVDVKTDLLPGGRDTEKLSLVGAVIGLVRGHEVARGHLPVNFRTEVGERGT